MGLWKKWIAFTKERAEIRVKRDSILYGSGIMRKEWWGWKRLDPFEVIMDYRVVENNEEKTETGNDLP